MKFRFLIIFIILLINTVFSTTRYIGTGTPFSTLWNESASGDTIAFLPTSTSILNFSNDVYSVGNRVLTLQGNTHSVGFTGKRVYMFDVRSGGTLILEDVGFRTIQGLPGAGSAAGNTGGGTLHFKTTQRDVYFTGFTRVENFIKSGPLTLFMAQETYPYYTPFMSNIDVQEGTLLLASSYAFVPYALNSVNVGASGTLQLDYANRMFAFDIRNISGSGSLVLNNPIYIYNSTNTTFSGPISGEQGLLKQGPGTLTLSGNNTFTGETTAQSGILEATNQNSLNTSSKVTLQSEGTLALQALAPSNSYTLKNFNGTGTLTIGSDTILDISDPQTFSGKILGSSNVTKTGSSSLLLSSDLALTGSVLVSNGTLKLAGSNTLLNIEGIQVDTNGVLQISKASTSPTILNNLSGDGRVSLENDIAVAENTPTTFSGVISGIRGVTKTGSENFTLSGSNTYTGPTNITNGTLTIQNVNAVSNSSQFTLENDTVAHVLVNNSVIQNLSSPSESGETADIIIDAHLVLNQSRSTLYNGTFTGALNIEKIGSGSLIFGNTHTHSGSTTIQDGAIILKGVHTGSDYFVEEGGTLRGIGFLKNLTNSGLVYPGQSIGTLTVNGDYIQVSGSKIAFDIDNEGASSLLKVTGLATIQSNATIMINPLPGQYVGEHTYILIDADGGVTGTFDNISIMNPILFNEVAYEVLYTSNQVQYAVRMPEVSTAVMPVSRGLPVVAGQNIIFNTNIISDLSNYFSKIDAHFLDDQCHRKSIETVVIGSHNRGHIKETSHTTATSFSSNGCLIGSEFMINTDQYISSYFTYVHGTSKTYNKLIYPKINSYTLGLAFRQYISKFLMELSGNYIHQNITYDRYVTNTLVSNGTTSGNGFIGQFQVLFLKNFFNWRLRPFISLNYNYIKFSKTDEPTSNMSQMVYSASNGSVLQLEPGLSLSCKLKAPTTYFIPEASVSYAKNIYTNNPDIAIQPIVGVGNATSIMTEYNPSYLKASTSITGIFCDGLSFNIESNWYLTSQYFSSWGAKGTLSYSF